MVMILLMVSLAQLTIGIIGLRAWMTPNSSFSGYGGICEGFHRTAASGDARTSCFQPSTGSPSSALSFNWLTEQSARATSSRTLPKYFACMSFPSGPGWQ
jgi:hypothetical protein